MFFATLWRDRLKSIFGSDEALPRASGNGQPSGASLSGNQPWPAGYPAEETTRLSRGLEQFLLTLRDQPTCAVLDLCGANQANINYITNLGHRISSESILHSLDTIWNDPNLSESRKIAEFVEQTFNYHASTFGGILVWDTLQYLPAPLLEAVLERLMLLLSPGGMVLSYFQADEKVRVVPAYSYRIVDGKTVMLSPRGLRNREQYFNNRAIEKLFEGCGAVKFFLTRDHLREVLVRR